MCEDESSENKPTIDPEIIEANQRWLKLMGAQSDIHRQTREPRLYRQSAKQKIIAPPPQKK